MTEEQARKLEVPTKWNGKANVCIYCGRVPKTFYIVTGHDHTDDSIRWCVCREYGQYKDEITTLRQRVAELEKEVAQWKNHHETEVRRARILKERTDMPIERVQAYEKWGKDMAERDALKRDKNYLLLNAEVVMKCIGDMGPSKPAVKAYSILQEAIASVKEKACC